MHALWVATSIAHRESVYVHMYLKERENEGESGRKIGTEPESFFFSHQDDYSVLRNERALLKIFPSNKISE